MHHNQDVRTRRFRSLIPIVLGILVMTTFWHVSHADFHTHGDSSANEAGADPLPVGDSVSLHPVHVVGYMAAQPVLALHTRWFVIADTESLRMPSSFPSGLFRPPRS